MVGAALVREVNRQPAALRWALALAFFALALAARLLIFPISAGVPFLTFFPAIFGAALLCGWAPAVAITALTAATSVFLFLPHGLPVPPRGDHQALSVAVFVFTCLLDILIVTALLNTIRQNQRLLRDQQLLFGEMQHRVANSLQFVAATLLLAKRDLATAADAGAVLEEAAARIQAMGQLHRRLHDATAYADGIAPVLRDVLAEIFAGLDVATSIEATIDLPLARATPAVLLVAEAATNSAKYAFRPQGRGAFHVRLRPTGPTAATLEIWDDGPGLPPDCRPGLGARIMEGLAGQLNGTLARPPGPGARIVVGFSLA